MEMLVSTDEVSVSLPRLMGSSSVLHSDKFLRHISFRTDVMNLVIKKHS